MKPIRFTAWPAAAAVLLVLGLLAGCGGGSAPDNGTPNTAPAGTAKVEIQGLAATGAAIANATVTATNRLGDKTTARTTSSGDYTLQIADGAPYLLSVTDATGRTWYSYAPSAGRANLTPLTTLALLQANANKPLDELALHWQTRQLSEAQVLDAAKVVNANLAPQLLARGVPPASTNVFTVRFSADGQGLDAVLDDVRVTIRCGSNTGNASNTVCTETLTSPDGTASIRWNSDIGTAGFTISWASGSDSGTVDIGLGSCRAPRAGTYSLIVHTSVSGFGIGSVDIPDVCIDGLGSKPASQADFCGDSTVREQLPHGVAVVSCRWDGSTGTIAAHIGLPIDLDYTVKFYFVQR